jgi:hypothetical protein
MTFATDTDRYVFNILRTYSRATDADMERGLSWYPEAYDIASAMSLDVLQAAGVIAILSARTPWERNVYLASSLFANGVLPSGHPFADHAARMHAGEPALSVLKGDKTRAFAQTIANAGVHDVTTIDGHAYDIADGIVWGKNRPNIGKRVYRAMDEAYHIAASATLNSNTEIQAITWVTHRRELGMDWRG